MKSRRNIRLLDIVRSFTTTETQGMCSPGDVFEFQKCKQPKKELKIREKWTTTSRLLKDTFASGFEAVAMIETSKSAIDKFHNEIEDTWNFERIFAPKRFAPTHT